jgi:uroporphyrin-III C-methyltransferase
MDKTEALATLLGRVPTLEPGHVWLAGAGPGDPGLLTLRGRELLGRCDALVYDRLADPRIVAMANPSAERIYAGKEAGRHALTQDETNALLVELGGRRACVVRLKGGDPFIFGRGGEEIATLSERGIPFEVVPGITAALGAAAYAGIPLTHRDYAQSCVFVTGRSHDETMDLDWPALARPRQTIVVYMGLPGLPLLCAKLVEHGLPARTRAAVVQQGTLSTQRVVTGTLASLPRLVAKAKLHAPTLIIVGEVVRLRDKLNWFAPGE